MNADLLNKVKSPRETPTDNPDPISDLKTLVDAANKKEAERQAELNGQNDHIKATDPIRLSKADALDPRKYAEAQRVPKERGVPFEITDTTPETTPTNGPDVSKIEMVEDTSSRVRYMPFDVIHRSGGIIKASEAQARDGIRLQPSTDFSPSACIPPSLSGISTRASDGEIFCRSIQVGPTQSIPQDRTRLVLILTSCLQQAEQGRRIGGNNCHLIIILNRGFLS